MKLLDLVTGPWAILPEKLVELQEIYRMHMRGEKIDIEAVEARLGRPLENAQQEYSVREGAVAVLPLMGVMAPRMNLFAKISGGVSTQMAIQQLQSMRVDGRVRSAVLAIDSPGGSVFGTPAMAAEIAAFGKVKPIVTVSQGTMASAAYWVGSAANAVYVEGVTDMVGSIGVYQRLGWDGAQANTHEITRGKYKRVSVNGQPPNAEVLAHHEGLMDHLYSVFVEAVASQRQATVDEVLELMADGRVFVGQQAIDAGLVDGVSTVDDMVEKLATNPGAFMQRRKAVFALGALGDVSDSAGVALDDVSGGSADSLSTPSTTSDEGADMADPITRESLERDHAALFAQIRSEHMAVGAQAERDRVAAVRAQSMPGHEALIDALVADGKTTGAEAAMAVLTAEKAARQAAVDAHHHEAPAPARADQSQRQGDGKKTASELAAGALALARGLTGGGKGGEQ